MAHDNPCQSCGACCAAFRVDFHVSECAGPASGGVPADMVVPVIRQTVRMKGTDATEPRCVALVGTVGHPGVGCAIYADRPSPCQDFNPYAALGMADAACARARRRHGLLPLGED